MPAVDNGQWGHVPKEIRDWFKSVKGKNGVSCCDISDGHLTSFEIKDGRLHVPIKGELVPIPPEAILEHTPNPNGSSVVWYTEYAGKVFVRCFVFGPAA